jgi:hypothetical protein
VIRFAAGTLAALVVIAVYVAAAGTVFAPFLGLLALGVAVVLFWNEPPPKRRRSL